MNKTEKSKLIKALNVARDRLDGSLPSHAYHAHRKAINNLSHTIPLRTPHKDLLELFVSTHYAILKTILADNQGMHPIFILSSKLVCKELMFLSEGIELMQEFLDDRGAMFDHREFINDNDELYSFADDDDDDYYH